MKKYVPLYEDIDNLFPDEFTDKELVADAFGYVDADSFGILTLWANWVLAGMCTAWLEHGAHSIGMTKINDKLFFVFYKEDGELKFPTNWIGARANLIMIRNFFQRQSGQNFRIHDDGNTVWIGPHVGKVTEAEEFPEEFTDAELHEPGSMVGKRVRLITMDDRYAPVPPGTLGTVKSVDSIGTMHVRWDNGSSLGLVKDIDKWELVKESDDFPKEFTEMELEKPRVMLLVQYGLNDIEVGNIFDDYEDDYSVIYNVHVDHITLRLFDTNGDKIFVKPSKDGEITEDMINDLMTMSRELKGMNYAVVAAAFKNKFQSVTDGSEDAVDLDEFSRNGAPWDMFTIHWLR